MVMILRTPRRRISPRTKHRYRTIRNFFRKALGSSSKATININSSIALNVSDLKHKIHGIDYQLSEANEHCSISEENSYRQTESFKRPVTDNLTHEKEIFVEPPDESAKEQILDFETKVLSRPSHSAYKKVVNSDYALKPQPSRENRLARETQVSDCESNPSDKKSERNCRVSVLTRHRPKSRRRRKRAHNGTINNSHYWSSLHSLAEKNYSNSLKSRENDNYYHSKKITQKYNKSISSVNRARHPDPVITYKTDTRNMEARQDRNRTKHIRSELDPSFIADIIRRQYSPVKLFDKNGSDVSLISAPVCRDQGGVLRQAVKEQSCLYAYDTNKRSMCACDIHPSDHRSISDKCNYSSKKPWRQRRHKRYMDTYNDSELYDVIPVKEKSSPKSRRKFAEDHISQDYYKEVPPSPRTHRPKFNLKAQQYDNCDPTMRKKRNTRKYASYKQPAQDYSDSPDSNYTVNTTSNDLLSKMRRSRDIEHLIKYCEQLEAKKTNKLETQTSPNQLKTASNHVTSHNKTQVGDESNPDKTDKALVEIKDILQHFLDEMKAATIHCDKDVKYTEKQNDSQEELNRLNTSFFSNPVTNCNLRQCSMPQGFAPPGHFTNQCCYPMQPMYPMNCLQNGYLVPNPSCIIQEPVAQTETDQLIKEIYKFVAQSPIERKTSQKNMVRTDEPKSMTARSVGENTRKPLSQNAKVGTPRLKSCSRSCEAIGCRLAVGERSATPSLPDVDRLNLTQSSSTSELCTEPRTPKAHPYNKRKQFSVFRSLGMMGRKKKDVIHEVSESEATQEVHVEVKPKSKPPFRQDILNYTMHGQKFYHHPQVPYGSSRPHVADMHHRPVTCCATCECERHPAHADYYEAPPCAPVHSECAMHRNDYYSPQYVPPYYPGSQQPTAPYPEPRHTTYPYPYNPRSQQLPAMSPSAHQPPVCFKEIEIRSTGTQSNIRTSLKSTFFSKLQKKWKTTPQEPNKRTFSTQTNNAKPSFWERLNDNKQYRNDALDFSLKTQKELAEGDIKMRNTLLKRMLHKKNPFSPNNMTMRTVLGKDKSFYGKPPVVFKQRYIM